MFRMALGVGSVAILVLSAAGCTMCCHPYDKSGPVFCDGCPSSACSRAGSIFAGSPEPSVVVAKNSTHEQPASPSPIPVQAKKQPRSSMPYAMTRERSASPSPAPFAAKKQHHPISYVMAARRSDSSLPPPAEMKEPQKPISDPTADNRAEGPMLGSAQPGDVPGSERIVSITERVVRSPADSSQAATEAPLTASKPLPVTGWTAHRPANELVR
jgi:hypothetical protein